MHCAICRHHCPIYVDRWHLSEGRYRVQLDTEAPRPSIPVPHRPPAGAAPSDLASNACRLSAGCRISGRMVTDGAVGRRMSDGDG